jgi:hypothetical protein
MSILVSNHRRLQAGTTVRFVANEAHAYVRGRSASGGMFVENSSDPGHLECPFPHT